MLPLGAWQIGRRAARHAGPALLVTLALAVAALSSTALAILDRGDHDQAVFTVGYGLHGRVRLTAEPDHVGVWPHTSARRDGGDDTEEGTR